MGGATQSTILRGDVIAWPDMSRAGKLSALLRLARGDETSELTFYNVDYKKRRFLTSSSSSDNLDASAYASWCIEVPARP
eukprot:3451528-Amphidinium_carterae.1